MRLRSRLWDQKKKVARKTRGKMTKSSSHVAPAKLPMSQYVTVCSPSLFGEK